MERSKLLFKQSGVFNFSISLEIAGKETRASVEAVRAWGERRNDRASGARASELDILSRWSARKEARAIRECTTEAKEEQQTKRL